MLTSTYLFINICREIRELNYNLVFKEKTFPFGALSFKIFNNYCLPASRVILDTTSKHWSSKLHLFNWLKLVCKHNLSALTNSLSQKHNELNAATLDLFAWDQQPAHSQPLPFLKASLFFTVSSAVTFNFSKDYSYKQHRNIWYANFQLSTSNFQLYASC